MSQHRSGTKTMLMSVLLSAPGPAAIGLSMILGRSSTQIADFLRKSAELLALICSFLVYRNIQKKNITDALRKAVLERRSNLFVGGVMFVSGISMVILAILSHDGEKGNVIPGMVIACSSMITNLIFWRKYEKMREHSPNAILLVQSRLYRAKAMVDICVLVALSVLTLFPTSPIAWAVDTLSSLVVAGYLAFCGIKTIKEFFRRPVIA